VAGWVSECAGALLEEGRRRGRPGRRRGAVAGRGQGGWGRREVEGRPDRWAPPVGEREREEREGGGAVGRVGRNRDGPRVLAGLLRLD
jgi:hypothetical protein